MYHPPSKKRQVLTRIAVYSLMNISIVLLLGISLLYTLGYRFDSQAQKVEQSGLIQYASVPPGASVKVDGSDIGVRSPTKSVVLPGTHEFVMELKNYETWRKSLVIESGTLTWLSYARLIPKKLSVEPITHLSTLVQTLSSPDKRFMAAITEASQPVFQIYDLTAANVKQSIITLNPTDYTDANTQDITHHFAFVKWDKTGRYLLVKHDYNDKTEWLVIDRQDGILKINVTKTMDIAIDDAQFSEIDGTQLFVLTGNDVRKINLTAGTMSRPVVTSVIEFHVHDDDTISYVSWSDAKKLHRNVGIVKNGKQTAVLHTSTADPSVPLHVFASHYFNKDYVVISEGKKLSLFSGEFPGGQSETTKLGKPQTFAVMSDVTSLGMNPSGRFVLAGYDKSYASYDIERQAFVPTIGLEQASKPRKLNWLDDYYLWSDQGGTLTLREFDGENGHVVNTVIPEFDVTLSQNGTYLYSIGPAKTGYQLQRVKLVL
jgi:hypothetical protein